jgi:hypothetical protein
MGMKVAIIGEEWEARFARETANSFANWLPMDAEVCVPSEFERTIAGYGFRQLHVAMARRPGFQTYEDVRQRVLQEGVKDGGLLLLAAGTLPASRQPIERLGASCGQQRGVEWFAPTEGGLTSVLHFQPPLHRPPARPHHGVEKVGALDVWTVDGGDNYFQALAGLEGSGNSPVWAQYGRHHPVFVYNTNDFDEPPPPAHEEYFILGSGLLGLRMITESRPAAQARVVVYDINPDQLLWIKFVLQVCGEAQDLAEVVDIFREMHGACQVRQVLAHEASNAARQAAWYRYNRLRLADIGAALEWEFLDCDLWNDPGQLLRRVRPGRSLFFMYLDLFVIWRVCGEVPWVENHMGVALSLEEAVRSRAQAPVTFLPGAQSVRFQLHPNSPFALKQGGGANVRDAFLELYPGSRGMRRDKPSDKNQRGGPSGGD